VSSNPVQAMCTRTTLSDKVCQWLTTGLWFSLGTPVSSTNKTYRHDIAEILLKVALNIINQKPNELWNSALITQFFSLKTKEMVLCFERISDYPEHSIIGYSIKWFGFWLMMFNATFNNISAISWRQFYWWRKLTITTWFLTC
jgi:hypothetical protein